MDGSGWQGVYNILQQHGYRVGIVQNPTISLDDDVAFTRRVIAAQPGPVILVGHSYGGVVITQAGNDPKVAGLVYIAAFEPDKGESVATLIANPPPGAPVPPILPPQMGSFCSTRRSSPQRSRPTFPLTWPTSWPIPKSRGRPGTRGQGQRGFVEVEAQLVSRRDP